MAIIIIIFIIIIINITRLYQIIQRRKRSQLLNLNNLTVINTLPAVGITVSPDVQTVPTGGEFISRGGHNPIVQYPDKGHTS